ncbi:unnamed protein product [Porites evermanni]|uniref:Uncharacterized protein n=1 Tax=Porites evermanni TaxID=104178 RepID=A0ABN8N6S7_9CNID|nr:unnamed protein product [Porites evermanni]
MGVPVRLTNVSVPNGGLQSHDMRMLQLLHMICNGTLAANTGLSTVTYIRKELLSGHFSAEAGRLGYKASVREDRLLAMRGVVAGSVFLLLVALLAVYGPIPRPKSHSIRNMCYVLATTIETFLLVLTSFLVYDPLSKRII